MVFVWKRTAFDAVNLSRLHRLSENMASFFDNKARAAAVASIGASSSKTIAQKENQNLQPWVEK